MCWTRLKVFSSIMASSRRGEAFKMFQSFVNSDTENTIRLYNQWALHYEQDVEAFSYRAPHLTTDFLHEHFTGDRAEAQVLDVACGSGLVAKLMFEQGFRDFVGVDGSEGMLLEAEKTGLYRKLELAILGPETLPAATGVFDVVIVAGALDEGFIPVSVVKELHRAAKPGGLVCIGRGEHSVPGSDGYKKNLEAEFRRMEEAGLWSLLALKQTHRYMEDAHQEHSEHGDQQGEPYISGTLYLYRKAKSTATVAVRG